MDSQDPRGAVSNLVRVLRKATRAAQFVSFIYLGVFSLCMTFCAFIPDGILSLLDVLMAATPAVAVSMLAVSRLFKLCIWHKVACTIPLLSNIEGYIDSFIITFTQQEVIVINAILGITSLVFIILAVRRFSNGRKRVLA